MYIAYMYMYLLESYFWADSNKCSNKEFSEEISIVEINVPYSSGALGYHSDINNRIGEFTDAWLYGMMRLVRMYSIWDILQKYIKR